MTKERAWPVKAIYILIAVALAMSLMLTGAVTHKVSANPGLSEWTKVSTPTTTKWLLAPNSTIIDYAVAEGGDVAYAIVYNENADPKTWELLKSTDGAATWSPLTDALKKKVDPIYRLWQVATDGVDPNFVAVCLWPTPAPTPSVYFSTDGGSTFKSAGPVTDGTSNLGWAYDLAVSPEVGGKRDIAIGGMKTSLGAALFRCTVSAGSPGNWADATGYTNWQGDITPVTAVVDIAFSPNWATDNTILVVTVNDTVTPGADVVYLQSGRWTATPSWSDAVTIVDHVNLPNLGPLVAGMALPSDYNGRNTNSRVLWVWVNYIDNTTNKSASTIVRVDNEDAYSLETLGQISQGKVWLTNISYQGTIASGKAIAGVLGKGSYSSNDNIAGISFAGIADALKIDETYLANCCEGVQVYRKSPITNMQICCETWKKACKLPTGRVAMDVSYVSADKAYAVALYGFPGTQGAVYDEGAWSVSFDDGDTWNQLSLIDTNIDYLSDVAVSPDCNKTYLVSVNTQDAEEQSIGCGCDSVWVHAKEFPEAGYNEYSGHWLRVWCGELGEEQWGLLRLNPEETTGETVYLVDYNTSTVYWSELEGLDCWQSAFAPGDIVDLAVKDATTVYALDAGGDVSIFDGDEWSTAVDSKVTDGWTIAVQGDYVLVGGQDGDVSYSADGGKTFTKLAKTSSVEGFVTVAFDSYFDTNKVIYAAVAAVGTDDLDGGIYKWVIGQSTSWMKISIEPSTFQLTGEGADNDKKKLAYTGLVVDRPGNPFTSPESGGVIYASYVSALNATTVVTGVARSLERTATVCTTCLDWDYLIVDLKADGWDLFFMAPDALKICGCLQPDTTTNLFAIGMNVDKYEEEHIWYDMDQGGFGTVWTFEDCYAKKAPEITSPANGAIIPADPCSCYSAPFTLTWGTLCDACWYEIEFALDEDFTMPVKVNGEGPTIPVKGDKPSYSIMGGQAGGLSCETTYYWRVRASEAATGQVIHSWWAEGTFSVAPSVEAGIITLVAPAPGASGQPTKNLGFSWNLLAEADKFDWVLDDNADFSSPVESKTGLTNNAYTCTKTLSYGTTYYWKVTAYNKGAVISESAVGTFTTAAQGAFCCPQCGLCFDTQAELQSHVAEAHAPVTGGTPAWVWAVIGIGAVLVIVVIVLIFRTRRV